MAVTDRTARRRRKADPSASTDTDVLVAGEGPATAQIGDTAQIAVLAPNRTPRAVDRLRRKMGRTSRYPLTILTLVFAVNVTQNSLLPAVFPLIKVEFRLSDTALGLLGSSFLIFASIGLVPFAIMADRYRRTTIIAWASVVWGALILVMGTAATYARLFAGRALLGLVDPAEQPTSYSLLTDYYRVEERGKVFAIWNIGQLAGVMLVPIAGVIADAFGWRAAFYLFSIPGFVLGLLVWRMKEPERGRQDRLFEQRRRAAEAAARGEVPDAAGAGLLEPEVGDAAAGDGDGAGDETAVAEADDRPRIDLSRDSIREALHGYLELLRIPTLPVAFLSIGFTSFLTRGLGIWLAVFFVRYHDMSLGQATGTVALLALGALIGSIGGGYLGDFLQRRGIRTGRIRLAAVSALLASVFLFGAFSTDHTLLMLGLFFVGSVFVFPPQPLLQAVVADVVDPRLRGRGASLDTLTQTAFGATSVFAFGVMSDAIGLRSTLLSVLPLVALAGFILWFLGGRFVPRDMDRMRARLLEEEGAAPDPVAAGS